MRRVSFIVCSVLLALGASGGSSLGAGLQDFAAIERGRYLANAADCGSCHTVPGSDHPFSGGRPIETPFGTLVAPNITPDRQTGIGDWTDDEFDAAVRQGRGRDGARLYPAMPFPYYARMSREDVIAIRAYLSTIESMHNPVRVNRLPFPLNIRSAMMVWDALYFKPGEMGRDPSKPGEWNRGAYLVQGPGHCGACHTAKTWLGGDEQSAALRGATLQGWTAPDVTSGPGALADWSVADIADYLKTGHNRYSAAAGLMAEVVELSTSRMSDADDEAIAVYLKDLSGQASPTAADPDQKVLAAGNAIYGDLCASCHATDGKGVPNLFPNLSETATVSAKDPATVVRVILQGAQSVTTDREPTGPAMPAFGWQLNNTQIAAVATYIRDNFGKKAAAVGEADVQKTRSSLAARAD